jgi:hypothetical protein
MHEHDERPLVIEFHDEGLDHLVFRDEEIFRYMVGAAMFDKGVEVRDECNLSVPQQTDSLSDWIVRPRHYLVGPYQIHYVQASVTSSDSSV